MIRIVILLSMLFLHIVDDYYLQGILAQMKQKKWWQKNAPQELYKHDYIMALAEHAFSWTFMIHIPIIVYYCLIAKAYVSEFYFITMFVINVVVHAIVDHLKANKLYINLVTDQTIHFIQVVLLWWFYALTY